MGRKRDSESKGKQNGGKKKKASARSTKRQQDPDSIRKIMHLAASNLDFYFFLYDSRIFSLFLKFLIKI